MVPLVAPTYVPRERPPPLKDEPLPAALLESALGAPNARSLERWTRERRASGVRDLWLAVVPGASEQWGHHRAPPRWLDRGGTKISAAFRERLERALGLLERDVVRFVLVSGGSVDRRRPDYNEALRGRDHLLSKRPDLADRVFVDPIACHSTTNLRNAARFATQLGLDRLVICTSMPPGPRVWPYFLPFVGQLNQGWYFLHHALSTFDRRCLKSLGYPLGRFEWLDRPDAPHAIVLRDWAADRLLADRYGP